MNDRRNEFEEKLKELEKKEERLKTKLQQAREKLKKLAKNTGRDKWTKAQEEAFGKYLDIRSKLDKIRTKMLKLRIERADELLDK